MRLVGGEEVVAEGTAGRIEHDDELRAIMLTQRLQEHIEHAENRAGGLALRPGQRRERVERTVEVRRAVDQHEVGDARTSRVRGGIPHGSGLLREATQVGGEPVDTEVGLRDQAQPIAAVVDIDHGRVVDGVVAAVGRRDLDGDRVEGLDDGR